MIINIQGNHLYIYDIGKCARKSIILRVKENTILLIKNNVFYTFIACKEEWLLKSQLYLPCSSNATAIMVTYVDDEF